VKNEDSFLDVVIDAFLSAMFYLGIIILGLYLWL